MANLPIANSEALVTRRERTQKIIDSQELGVSFSLLACREYAVDWEKVLSAMLSCGFKRFRLMSYWSIHEMKRGQYDFSLLDKQLALIQRAGGRATLAIGMRQPRWPETHLPDWTKKLSPSEVTESYMAYHEAVVRRYGTHPAIESWQLENEFWLRSFGQNFDYSRQRLVREFDLIRQLDPSRPIIMSLSNFGSMPLFRPTPDIFATSMYRVIYDPKKGYTKTKIAPLSYRMKRFFIRTLRRRDMIVHELQAEPWGPKANWEMTIDEQNQSVDRDQMLQAVIYAKASGITYIDLWGAEWWYWRKAKHDDSSLMRTVSNIIRDESKIENATLNS